MLSPEALMAIERRRARALPGQWGGGNTPLDILVDRDVPALLGNVRGLRSLVERLAEDDPWVDASDSGFESCWWCGAQAKVNEPHRQGCPWLEARRLLGQHGP
jgi:hypothetical protein